MKNKLTNLNDYLFLQMERLNEENISTEKLASEIERSRAITSVAKEIVSNARLVLDAKIRVADIPEKTELPAMLK